MAVFSVGNLVIMNRPAVGCTMHKGVIGEIVDMEPYCGEIILKIDSLGENRWWTEEQFDLYNITLENK